MTNPFAHDRPEWQLYENARAEELKVTELLSVSEAKATAARSAREKADRYWTALEKLVGKSVRP